MAKDFGEDFAEKDSKSGDSPIELRTLFFKLMGGFEEKGWTAPFCFEMACYTFLATHTKSQSDLG